MRLQKSVDRLGRACFSFTYLDSNGKRHRLKKSEVPAFRSEKEAKAWGKSQDAYRASEKAYLEKKLAWQKTYDDFRPLLERYGQWQEKRAPNSWKSSVCCLRLHVFNFFLGVKECNNVNQWHLLFTEFVDH